MTTILIIGSILVIIGICFMLWTNSKQSTQIQTMIGASKARQDKVRLMLRELDIIFKAKNPPYQKKTHLDGMMQAMENEIGQRQDEAFIGWVLVQKQIKKRGY